MPELPEALRAESLAALEEADNALLPALLKALDRVFGKAQRRFKEAHGLLAAVSPDDFDDLVSDWTDEVERTIVPIVAELYEDSARGAFRLLSADDLAAFKVSDPAFAEFMGDSANRLRDVGDRAWARLRESLAEGIGNGETQQELQARIRDHLNVSRARAERIARTEARAARNGGAMAGARALGDHAPAFKQWVATLDGRTRPSHAGADGQVRKLEDRFDVGGASLDYPGDPSGPADEVINCRCRWVGVDEPDAELEPEGRQMEVSTLAEVEKRGDFREVMAKAERMGVVHRRSALETVEQAVVGVSDFLAQAASLTADIGSLEAMDPATWWDSPSGTGRGTWRDAQVLRAPGPEALEAEARFRALGAHVDTEVKKRLAADGIDINKRATREEIDMAKHEWEVAGRDYTERYSLLFDDNADEMFRQAGKTLTDEQWMAVKRLTDAILDEENQRVKGLLQRYLEMRNGAMVMSPPQYQLAYRTKTIEVLGEIRDYGHLEFDVQTRGFQPSPGLPEARQAVVDAGQFYPDAWVQQSNARGVVMVNQTAGRAWHAWLGGASEIQQAQRVVTTLDPTGWSANAVHELGHRFEQLRPHIRTMEWTFHQRRTFRGGVIRSGEQEATRALGAGYEPHEVFREDEFIDPYVGKVYSDAPDESWELFQMGVQYLFTDVRKNIHQDQEFLHLVLGLLAGG